MNENLQPFEVQREALVERLKLKEQWESQVRILNEAGILEILPESQEFGIVGIDGKEYPVPSYEDILSKITPETAEILEKKAEQGFNKLLLVPFAMPLDILIKRYKEILLKKDVEGTLLGTDGTKLELDRNRPVSVWEEYNGADASGDLVYNPQSFDENHQGKTKRELIDQGGPWRIELIENLPDLPAQGKGKIIGGRIQLEANHSPNECLNTLKTNPIYSQEKGLDLEAWLIYALTNLKEKNQQIDDWQGQAKVSLLVAAYLQSSDRVPIACWNRDYRQAYLGRDDPFLTAPDFGFRSSVEIP